MARAQTAPGAVAPAGAAAAAVRAAARCPRHRAASAAAPPVPGDGPAAATPSRSGHGHSPASARTTIARRRTTTAGPTAVTPAGDEPASRATGGGPGATGRRYGERQRARAGPAAAAPAVCHISFVPKRTRLRLGRTGVRRYGSPFDDHRARSHLGGSRVPQAARRQPGRDRDPGLPRRLRARPGDGGGLPLRGPQLAAPREGRRVVPDRRARPPGAGLPVGRRGDRRGAAGGRRRDLPRLRVPVGEPDCWPRRAPRPGSSSSGRRRRCCT